MGNDSPIPSPPVWASIMDYGAVGNGVADDTAALVAAIAAIPPQGGVLLIPPGSEGPINDDNFLLFFCLKFFEYEPVL